MYQKVQSETSWRVTLPCSIASYFLLQRNVRPVLRQKFYGPPMKLETIIYVYDTRNVTIVSYFAYITSRDHPDTSDWWGHKL